MDNANDTGFRPYDENDYPHASMNSYESHPNTAGFMQIPNQSFTYDEAFTAGGSNDFSTANNYAYAFNENTLPQPTVNHLWQPMPSTYQEMYESQYAFNQFALPQTAVANAYGFNFPADTSQALAPFESSNLALGASTFIDHQALEQTLTDSSTQGGFALSGDTTGGLQPTLVTGSDADAPFEIDESDVGRGVDFGFHRTFMDGSLTCPWRGCNKTTPFKTEKLLETHLDNIHRNPLYCTQQGCSYSRPFPKKGDFDRHLATKHGIGRLFRCPQRECPRHAQPFGRRDKLREHVNKEEHGLFHCQYSHCGLNSARGLFAKEDVAKHETDGGGWYHGEYECAVGSCEGSTSFFSKSYLKYHLWLKHFINDNSKPVDDLLAQGLKRFTTAHVNGLPGECYFWGRFRTTCDECEKKDSNRTTTSL